MSRKIRARLRKILYHRRISREMRRTWEKEYNVTPPASLRLPSLYDVTTHEQRLKMDDVIEEITGKHCDDGIDEIDDEHLIEILEQVLKDDAKKRKEKLKTELAVQIA